MAGRKKKAPEPLRAPAPLLLAAAREKRLVVFAGAGISMDPPTALPSWWDLSSSVVRSLATRAGSVISDSAMLANIIVERQKAENFPPDYVAEKIVHSIQSAYFEVLRCIDSDRPNANHLALAELAATDKLRAIITTNFDRTIEAAFALRKVPLEVRADPASAAGLLSQWDQFEKGGLPCQLIKIHGTADRPDTIIDTLAQRALGIPGPFLECGQRLLAFGYWGVLGFSGADLETQPDYFGLAHGSANGRGFTWLVQVGTKPREGVNRLMKAWASKAQVVEGKLPDLLLDLLEGAQPLQPLKSTTKPVDVVAEAQAWARQIPERRCALIIAELLSFSAETARSRKALEELAATYPQHHWKITGGWSGNTLVLKADDDKGSPPAQPKGFGDPAKPLVVGLVPQLDDTPYDRANYADTLYGLADVLDQLGDTEAAASIAKRSILAGLFAGGRTRIVRGLGILADLRAAESTPAASEEADRLYAAAIEAAEKGSLIEANLTTNRARNLIATLDKKEQAFGLLMHAAELFRALGDERGRAAVGLALADLGARVGDIQHAAMFWTDVLTFARRVGDEPMRFEAAMGLGRVFRARGEADVSNRAFGEAQEAAEALGDPARKASVRKALLEA
jgi:tetratricopeptide (TPR) repeat protein